MTKCEHGVYGADRCGQSPHCGLCTPAQPLTEAEIASIPNRHPESLFCPECGNKLRDEDYVDDYNFSCSCGYVY